VETVRIRPLGADDVERLQAMHRRLSPEAIRLRFHGFLRELPDEMARHFCAVDGYDRAAFAAVIGEPERIVGVGRYDWLGDGLAEVAFVVEDGYQGRGIGTRLCDMVIDAARLRGAHTVLAQVVHGNSIMRRMLERTGRPLRNERTRDADCLYLTIADEAGDT
jgi:RimJ/RimL family protein N-acetyltransferase